MQCESASSAASPSCTRTPDGHLARLCDKATLHPEQAEITYAEGSIVVHRGTLYRALAENTAKPPDQNAELWEELPAPADDVRLSKGSPHAGLGVRWPPAIP
jgi:hypothetical protein